MNYKKHIMANKFLMLFWCVAIGLICNGCREDKRSSSQTSVESSFKDEDVKFETRLTALPQVVSYTKLLSKKNRELKIWCTDTLVFDDVKYVHYHVGEDNGTNLVTAFHFAQRVGSNKVFIYDVINDRLTD